MPYVESSSLNAYQVTVPCSAAAIARPLSRKAARSRPFSGFASKRASTPTVTAMSTPLSLGERVLFQVGDDERVGARVLSCWLGSFARSHGDPAAIGVHHGSVDEARLRRREEGDDRCDLLGVRGVSRRKCRRHLVECPSH